MLRKLLYKHSTTNTSCVNFNLLEVTFVHPKELKYAKKGVLHFVIVPKGFLSADLSAGFIFHTPTTHTIVHPNPSIQQ